MHLASSAAHVVAALVVRAAPWRRMRCVLPMPILTATASDLAGILAARNDPMLACRESPWLRGFLKVPRDAAVPLAMSGRHPRAVGSYGAECIEWARRELGVTLRWWQALALTRQLEHDEDGALVWREIVDTGPRRVGKSVRLRVVALWRIANAERIGEPQIVMLVSKDLAVGKEIHRPSWPWAERRGWNVIRLGGAQEVQATFDDRWLLRADTAVYGYDVSYGQVDESWGVDPAAITDGLEPALLERIWPQLHFTSTAHVKATSLMRRRLVAALRDVDPNVLLMLWSAHPDADYADEATWKASSPHWSKDRRDLMARKYAAALAGVDEPEFDDPDPVRGWASQYLNVWPRLLESVLPIFPKWSDLATSTLPGEVQALGVASDVDGVWLSLGAVSAGARPHLGSVLRLRAEEQPQFVREVKRVQDERSCVVAIDVKGPAGHLVPKLEKAGVELKRGGIDDYVEACADLDVAVGAGIVEHGDYTVLNDAVSSATWRKVGDRRVFGRKDGDISMLEAVTWGYWGAQQAPVRRPTPMASFA